jgi:hypothetical protein
MDVYVFPQVSLCGIAQVVKAGAVTDQSSATELQEEWHFPACWWLGMLQTLECILEFLYTKTISLG